MNNYHREGSGPAASNPTRSSSHALFVRKLLEERYIPKIIEMDHFDGERVDPPYPISWFPNGLAWAMTTPKNVVRRHPPFAAFQKFLVSETGAGNISRQEVVSMIPPLLMDVQPHMTVLDLCAAPGSKAAQLLELVHAGEESRILAAFNNEKISDEAFTNSYNSQNHEERTLGGEGDTKDGGRSMGLLVANDADYKRSHMLIHQMKRLDSPNLIVTNHDATMYPLIRMPSKSAFTGTSSSSSKLMFDRILADVPCSGDGTPRKNLNVWKDWTPGNALGLHGVQSRILLRALQMLKVGGRVVYSTCSMNPVENEAVVAGIIQRCGGSSIVEIVNCEQQLPELKRRPGLMDWNVMDRAGRIWASWKSVKEQRETGSGDGLGRLTSSMFPPMKHANDNDVKMERIPLERCMRIYPHLQDTGAFFIAVLEKRADLKTLEDVRIKESDHQPSIVAAADAISAGTSEVDPEHRDTLTLDKISAIDEILPLSAQEVEDASAVFKRNHQNNLLDNSEAVKHTRNDEAAAVDAVMANKRPKFDEGVDDIALMGGGQRKVNFPPPPAVLPDIPLDPPDQNTPTRLNVPESLADQEEPTPNRKPQGKQQYEEPFKYLAPDHAELNVIYKFFDLSPRFPRDRFMVRNALGQPSKSIYYTAAVARDILQGNEGRGIRFVHSGVKMFVRQDVQRPDMCKWRVQMEGLPLLEPWLGEKRIVRLQQRDTLRRLLLEMFPKVGHEGWRLLGEIGERVRDIEPGCCVLKVEANDGVDGFP